MTFEGEQCGLFFWLEGGFSLSVLPVCFVGFTADTCAVSLAVSSFCWLEDCCRGCCLTFANELLPILLFFNLGVGERLGASCFGSVDRFDSVPLAMSKIREYLKSLTCICEKSSGRPSAMCCAHLMTKMPQSTEVVCCAIS